ncbi:MAG: anti-phage ZorAB system protein ZorA, partial [Devosia sp.]
YMFDMLTPLDVGMIRERVGAVLGPVVQGREFAANSIANLSQQDFAFSLAGLLGAFGAGLLLAFIALHAIAIRFSLWRIGRSFRSNEDDRLGFAQAYETAVYPKLRRHPLIGHAWREFDETLLKGEVGKGGVIGNTVRPQSFINYGLVRERLMGLKMIGSIPGYFVGIGLLLTFTGIVLALHKASEATTASLISNDTPAMMTAMTDLLGVASFKFATSIAGLGVSIILALLFKMIVIGIEASFAQLCERIEAQLRFTAPQSIAAEMNETAKEQTAQLKEINSDRFFSRMGEQFAPQVAGALESAIAPMTQSIDDAMKAMSSQSQTGVGDMIDRFSSSVQGSAGTELRQLGETLAKMHTTLEATQKGLHGTGEEFATRMSEAANALRETFDRANTKLDSDLGAAASGASAKVEDAMGRVMERLEGQVGTLMAGLAAFGTSNAANLNDTANKVAAAQQAAVDGIASASSEAAKALEAGLGEALGRVAAEIERFAVAMRSGETALAQQATAIEAATDQTRQVAGSFTQTASDVRTASGPLLQAGDRIAKASEQMGVSIDRATSSLETGNAATTALAASPTGQLGDLREIWESYRTHFDRVDESLGRAVEQLGQASDGQLQTIKRYATEMNSDLATVMNSFKPLLENLEQNSDSIAGSVESLAKTLPRLAAE